MKVDDKVVWTSQAAGRTSTKEGVIIAVVIAGKLPTRSFKIDMGTCIPRKEESYVVYVPAKNRYYWPRVKNLKLRE
jgi:hypothetical protein